MSFAGPFMVRWPSRRWAAPRQRPRHCASEPRPNRAGSGQAGPARAGRHHGAIVCLDRAICVQGSAYVGSASASLVTGSPLPRLRSLRLVQPRRRRPPGHRAGPGTQRFRGGVLTPPLPFGSGAGGSGGVRPHLGDSVRSRGRVRPRSGRLQGGRAAPAPPGGGGRRGRGPPAPARPSSSDWAVCTCLVFEPVAVLTSPSWEV